ncbi:DNAlig [Tomelloso virus]|uniref:DNA ligase n=1 Tax=Tomelloso virus TaxID=2053981 RepID=A0A2H4T2V3_9VIRU|nr:DNAlig [Tomelloso virus]ATY70210.1 DNAlig [Tomelloso virus]
MFSIKRKAPKRHVAKRMPYFRLPEDDNCPLTANERMPNIEQMQSIKPQNSPICNSVMIKTIVPNLPMLASPVEPHNITALDEYVYEEKYDGERMLAIAFDSHTIKCFTRNLKLSNIFKHPLPLKEGYTNCIFDGELIYLDDEGKILPICDTGTRSILQLQYRIFDLQMLNGENVMHLPLLKRKQLLSNCLYETEIVKLTRFTQCQNIATTMEAFDQVCADGGEGLMLKHCNSNYMPDVRKWFKLKSLHLKERRQDFDLYAYRLKKDKNGVPNILDCGYFDEGSYVHVSNVSSGIDGEKRVKLKLLSDPATGLFKNRVIVTIHADKITLGKSLRHPSLYRIRTDLSSVDISNFVI